MKLSPSDMAVFMADVRNRQRIYSDSTKIAQTTTNVDVYLGRIDAITEYVEWSYAQKDKGMPLIVNMEKDAAFLQLHAFINHHCLRIAEDIAEKAKAHKIKAADAIASLCDLHDTLKDAVNKQSTLDKIHQLNLSLLKLL